MRIPNETALSREEALAYPLPKKEAMFGDRAFYEKVLTIALPMIAQNTLTNVVSLLDNVMVGRIGTLPMSAVAIDNQIIFVFYLCIWGGLSGAGIYTAQFFGKGDYEGVRQSMRVKFWAATLMTILFLTLLFFAEEALLGSYIAADTPPAVFAETMGYAKQYMHIIMIGFVPFALSQVYAGTLRESGQTTLPMIASMTAMTVNFVFNLLLIFGYLGFPRLGVVGAAIATTLSRFVEVGIIVIGAHRNTEKYRFLRGLYSTLLVPLPVVKKISAKILPLLCNEFLWSAGQAALMQSYSVRGLGVVAATNITTTISGVFMEVFLSIGYVVGVMTGQELGANRLVTARLTAWRLATFGVLTSIGTGVMLIFAAPFLPGLYNTEPEIRQLATTLLMIFGVCMPIEAYNNAAYFTMRSGGKTFITFVFDACFVWLLQVPTVWVLSRYSALSLPIVYLVAQLLGLLKCALGFWMVKRGMWVNNIVADQLLEA